MNESVCAWGFSTAKPDLHWLASQDISDIDNVVPNVIFSLLIAATSLLALGGLITALQPYFLVGAVRTAASCALPLIRGKNRDTAQACSPPMDCSQAQ